DVLPILHGRQGTAPSVRGGARRHDVGLLHGDAEDAARRRREGREEASRDDGQPRRGVASFSRDRHGTGAAWSTSGSLTSGMLPIKPVVWSCTSRRGWIGGSHHGFGRMPMYRESTKSSRTSASSRGIPLAHPNPPVGACHHVLLVRSNRPSAP